MPSEPKGTACLRHAEGIRGYHDRIKRAKKEAHRGQLRSPGRADCTLRHSLGYVSGPSNLESRAWSLITSGVEHSIQRGPAREGAANMTRRQKNTWAGTCQLSSLVGLAVCGDLMLAMTGSSDFIGGWVASRYLTGHCIKAYFAKIDVITRVSPVNYI